MEKKRRDGKANKRGDSAASPRNSRGGLAQQMATDSLKTVRLGGGDVYEGELKDGRGHGRGVYRYGNGDVYDGEFKDGLRHGRGIMTTGGDVYDGEWKDGQRHGNGVYKYEDGRVYEGEWANGTCDGWGTTTLPWGDVHEGTYLSRKAHGKGTVKYASGALYDGEFVDGKMNGQGTMKYASGKVYKGEWVNGQRHGKGTLTFPEGNVYEGGYKEGKEHGWGAMKLPTGNIICEGIWTNGKFTPNADKNDTAPEAGREPFEGRKLRSPRSQQRRLETDKKACEHCGVDDYRYKLRVCSACNLALYCSAACQKAASRSHRRICDISSMLPSRDSDRLTLEYDKEKLLDLDACLRYATKYMDNLKHLAIGLHEMGTGDSVKLSAKQLTSLVKTKKGKLDSLFWEGGHAPGISNNAGKVWKALHDLKQLRLQYMGFDEVQSVHDIIDQQKETLEVLRLPYLGIDCSKAKCRRTVAQAVGACRHLVNLNLDGFMLTDSDLKVMLQNMPGLRILSLVRDTKNNHEFTDNTCGLIARKCPGLQDLNLFHHNQLSVKGIRKIFEGCIHLRTFCTTTLKLSCKDIRSLLGIASQLMDLSLSGKLGVSAVELDEIVEATGGRTVLWPGTKPFQPESVSAKTKLEYERQRAALSKIWFRRNDPEVANEWEGIWDERD